MDAFEKESCAAHLSGARFSLTLTVAAFMKRFKMLMWPHFCPALTGATRSAELIQLIFGRSCFALGLALTLSSCGVVGGDSTLFCGTACSNPNQWRTEGCDCVDKPGFTASSPGNGSNSLDFTADCICDGRDGSYIAWFLDSLTEKSWVGGKIITVRAAHCAYLNLCPVFSTSTGGYQYYTVNGHARLNVTNLGWDGTLGGNYIRGTVLQDSGALTEGTKHASGLLDEYLSKEALQRAANLRPNNTSSLMMAAFRPTDRPILMSRPSNGLLGAMSEDPVIPSSPRWTNQRGLKLNVQATMNPLDCLKACKGPGDCPEAKIPIQITGPLQQLRDRVANLSIGSIEQAALASSFGMSTDPCGRGDTNISAGRMRNSGGACTLSTGVNLATRGSVLLINVPKELSAAWRSTSEGAEIVFDDSKAAPSLQFTGENQEALNGLFGGTIRSAGIDRLVARIATDASCIITQLTP